MGDKTTLFVWLLVSLPTLLNMNANASSNTDEHALNDTKWHLIEFQSMSDRIGIVRPEKSSQYTMTLNADGTVSMQLNCNRGRGKWSATPGSDASSGRFEMSQLVATRALCPTPGMGESIAAQSQYIRAYILRDDKLYLSLMADAGIYVWQRENVRRSEDAVPLSPEQGGPLNWEVATRSGGLNLRQQPSAASRIISTIPGGEILDNLGCEETGGRFWCYVQLFGGGPVGYVAAEYLKPAVSPNGAVVHGPDNSSLRAGQGDFDATGNIPCAKYLGQPLADCQFGVARTGGGYATVIVEKADKLKRALFFRMGKATGASTSEAEGYRDFRARKESDLHIIRVGEERYEIPDAVIFGG